MKFISRPFIHVAFIITICLWIDVFSLKIPLVINETIGASRANMVISNGIPLSKHSNLIDANNLHIEDESGNAIDGQLTVLSRWKGGVKGATPIQWLLVSFFAEIEKHSSTTFFLCTGSYINKGTAIATENNTNEIIVNTGAISVSISKTKFNIFNSLKLTSNFNHNFIGSDLGTATILVEGKPLMTAQAPEETIIESQGPLVTIVKVAGHFNNAPYDGKYWRYIARYTFYAGSPTIDFDFYYSFPGSVIGGKNINAYDKKENYIKILNVSVNWPISVGNKPQGYISADDKPSVQQLLTATEKASLFQQLRPSMSSPPKFSYSVGSINGIGTFATKPFLAIHGDYGGIGIAIQKMKWYEPQSIIGSSDLIKINIVADSQWIGPYMGAYAKASITCAPSTKTWDLIRDEVLLNLDNKLFIFPDRYYSVHSGALDEIWDGTSNALAESYLTKMNIITQNTVEGFINYGMHGFMTYGLAPREWYKNNYNEFGLHPDTWDGYFFGATFTDYHNMFANVVKQFAITGNSELLNILSIPAARRMANTMAIQDEPDNLEHYFNGWAPIGYGGYRTNHNSSHSYFENLFYYYYLTGDKRILDILTPAGNILRKNFTRNNDNSLIPSNLPAGIKWRTSEGRDAAQHAAIFWFLAHASNDSTFFSDFINQYERFIDRHCAFLQKDGTEYVFISNDNVLDTATSMTTSQIWMSALYDLENFWKIYSEYGDLVMGKRKIKISRLFKGISESYWNIFSTVLDGESIGVESGRWTNQLVINWEGSATGGQITAIAPSSKTENLLYPTSKSVLLSVMFRSAVMNRSQIMFNKAKELLTFIEKSIKTNLAWCKESSLLFIRLHAAIAYNANEKIVMQTGDYTNISPATPGKFLKPNSLPQISVKYNNFTHIYTFVITNTDFTIKNAKLNFYNLEGRNVDSIYIYNSNQVAYEGRRLPPGKYIAELEYQNQSLKAEFSVLH